MRIRLPFAVSLLVATLVLHLVLIQPNHPGAMTWGAVFVFPLELPFLILALVALGQTRAARVLRALAVAALTLIVVLKTADFVSFKALSRGFNPIADVFLVDAFVRLLSGAVGPVLAGLAVLAACLAVAAVAALLWWSMGVWARCALPPSVARGAAVAAGLAGVVMVADAGRTMGAWSLPFNPPGIAFTARVGAERVQMVQTTLSELAEFRTAMREDPFVQSGPLLGAIDRDVLVIFVESYGRTSFDTPQFAETHRATLERYEARLSDLGLSMRSGFLTSPTRGGQSWLAHATLANGLWIDSQIRYGAALSSGRDTLFHIAARNGFHTAAVMPQITMDWPEADRMGFETVLPAAALGYQGLPFNWVTMPDQFTLSALDQLLRMREQERPVFAQIALSSSHAPWTPIPEVLAWDEIGDGSVYNDVAVSGDPPDVVWRDRDRVRDQYRLAIDYALQTVLEYAALHASEPPLLLIIGDHQAAGFVALDERSDVPIHVIGPEHLVTPLSGLAPDAGLLPASDLAPADMAGLRDEFLRVYSTSVSAELAQ